LSYVGQHNKRSEPLILPKPHCACPPKGTGLRLRAYLGAEQLAYATLMRRNPLVGFDWATV